MPMDYVPQESVHGPVVYPQAYYQLVDLPEQRLDTILPEKKPALDGQVKRQNQDSIQTEQITNVSVREGDMVSAEVRLKVIREAAVTLAVRNGLTWRYDQIQQSLKKIEPALDEQFNFSGLLLKNNIMPPVIVESGAAWSSDNRSSATESKITYEIVQDARIVSVTPTWRNYLIKDFSWNYDVPYAVLPQTGNEQEVWERGLKYGWSKGVEYAERLFDENLARLERDFVGASRYLLLAKQGIVSDVISVRGAEQVVRKGRLLSIGQSQIRLARDADYQPVNEWKPIVIQTGEGR